MPERRKEKEQQYLEKKKREKEEQERCPEIPERWYVNPCYAVEMFRRNNMNVHPRTLWNLQNYCSQVSRGIYKRNFPFSNR